MSASTLARGDSWTSARWNIGSFIKAVLDHIEFEETQVWRDCMRCCAAGTIAEQGRSTMSKAQIIKVL